MAFPRLFRSAPRPSGSPRTNNEEANEEGAIPYPSGQLFVLGCCRLSEPISMTSSSPYIYFMIRDFHIANSEKEIGRYAGFLSSCYSLSQFLTGNVLISVLIL
jgi:hypothetical protein